MVLKLFKTDEAILTEWYKEMKGDFEERLEVSWFSGKWNLKPPFLFMSIVCSFAMKTFVLPPASF